MIKYVKKSNYLGNQTKNSRLRPRLTAREAIRAHSRQDTLKFGYKSIEKCVPLDLRHRNIGKPKILIKFDILFWHCIKSKPISNRYTIYNSLHAKYQRSVRAQVHIVRLEHIVYTDQVSDICNKTRFTADFDKSAKTDVYWTLGILSLPFAQQM